MNDSPQVTGSSGNEKLFGNSVPAAGRTSFGQAGGTASGSGLSGAGEPLRVEYVKQPGLGGIAITNFLLNLVTLWFYRFWAKTRVRRHIWDSIRINGEPLEYTGTGKELFFGFLVIMAIIFLPLALIAAGLAFYFGPESVALNVFQIGITLVLVCFYGFAIYRARRYRLSRTVWRGIRGALTGSALAYSGKYLGALILNPMTAGWSRPAMNLLLAEQMYNDMRFGNQPFTFRGRAGPLYARYAVCWFLTAAVFIGLIVIGTGIAMSGVFDQFSSAFEGLLEGGGSGSDAEKGLIALVIFLGIIAFMLSYQIVSSLIWSIYTARELNLFAQYTSFPGLRFDFNATAGSLVTLWLGNIAILILTLGIGAPFVEQRVMKYFCDRLSIDGVVDLGAIKQSQAKIDSRGEGLIDALDLDAF
jgi:uncharacterized membrane protein YjgN (DUF898 family)